MMMKRNRKWFCKSLLLGALVLLGISKSVSAATRETAFVSKVIDGDTIVLQDGRKVRYIGVDTPETVHPNKEIGCFGQQASDKNKQLVLGKTVELEKDVSDTDRYGRLLRYVYLDGVMINEKLVAEGYATVVTYPPDVKYKDTFLAAQANARQAKLGLWSDVCADGSVPETTKKQKNAASASTKNNSTAVKTVTVPAPVTTQTNAASDTAQCPNNCTQAREMGMTNMTPSHPCWQDKFDNDKDGVGCESGSASTKKATAKATPVPTPIPTPAPVVTPEAPPEAPAPQTQCPDNCTQAKQMGMTNMTPGHPCWQDKFDRDKDGIGCEQ